MLEFFTFFLFLFLRTQIKERNWRVLRFEKRFRLFLLEVMVGWDKLIEGFVLGVFEEWHDGDITRIVFELCA
jgi:hypothetical protein